MLKQDELSKKETKKLVKRLDEIEKEQYIAWSYNRHSGGYVHAEYDYCDEDKVYITLTDGIQNDVTDTKNIAYCSLWRDTLEWTD